MAIKTADDLSTVTGSQWVDSIADVVSGWIRHIQHSPAISHLTIGDRGRCHTIILLLMVMLESYSQKAAVDSEIGEATRTKQFDVTTWWKSTDYIAKEDVLDAWVLRNVLAHNHLYSYSQSLDDAASPRFNRISHSNDVFKSRATNGKLNHTGMNGVPDLIGPHEVIEVSRIVRDALGFLPKLSPRIGSTDFKFVRRKEFSSLWKGIEVAAKSSLETLSEN